MVDEHKITVGQVFKHFRQLPEMRKLIEDCYYDEDFLGAAKRFYKSEEFTTVLDYISSKGKQAPGLVLDLGGGNGVASLAYHWAGYQVVLAEPDDDDIVGIGAIAPFLRTDESKIGVCKAVGEYLPFYKGAFDIVYARQVLHHVSDLDVVCGEAYRVLRPNGLFIGTREHVISKSGDLTAFLNNHPVHRYTGGENAHLLREYRAALIKAGFRQVKVLGPWESVINYYPMTRSEYVDQCRKALSRYLGVGMGGYLSTLSAVLKICGLYLTKRDRTPGRLYSFLATR